MRLQLTTQGLSPVQAVWSPKGHVQPHRSHLPRRRHVKRFVVHDTDDEVAVATPPPAVVATTVDAATEALAKLDIYAPAPQQNVPHLQEVIPRLILGFMGSEDSVEDLQPNSAKPFSHIISVLHGDATTAGSSQSSSGPGLQRLYLFIAPRDATSGRAGLGLTDAQLRRARDYIGEVIPTPESVQNPADYLRILITTPHGNPTNALCVLACYLAFISDKNVEEILNFIDEEEDYLSAWKGEVSEDEIERVEKIARAWSWLSHVRRPSIDATGVDA